MLNIVLTCLSLCNTQARAVNLIHGILWDDEGVTLDVSLFFLLGRWLSEQSITKHWFQSVRTCPYSWATGRNNGYKKLI